MLYGNSQDYKANYVIINIMTSVMDICLESLNKIIHNPSPTNYMHAYSAFLLQCNNSIILI